MIGFSRRFSTIFLVAIAAAGCSAADEQPGADPQSPGGLDLVVGDQAADIDRPQPSDGNGDGERPNNEDYPPDDDVGVDEPTDTEPGDPGMPPSGTGGSPACACDIKLPGIDIAHTGDELKITVELLEQLPLVVRVAHGSAQTFDHRLQVDGDLMLDMGNAGTLSMLDAGLRIDVGSGGVAVTADATRLVGLDTSTLQLAACGVDLTGAHLELLPCIGDAHRLLKVTGGLADLGHTVWAPELPIAAGSDLWATAWIDQGVTTRLELSGDLKLGLDALSCGSHPLDAAVLPSAVVALGQEALTVTGELKTSIDSRLRLLGDPSLTATFTEHEGGWDPASRDWSIQLCGAPMLNSLLDLVKSVDCLNLDVSGPSRCHD